MSDENTQTGDNEAANELPQMDELTMLKERARVMGISHSGNIGVDALKAKIQAKLDGEPEPMETGPNPLEAGEISAPAKEETRQEIRKRLHKEAMRLIRVRITNLDPKKKDLQGEIYTVGNEFLGTIRKFVPYGEASDAGYHIPHILLEELRARKFLDIKTSKKAGQIHVEQRWSREFSIEVLEPLTPNELARLAASQAAAGTFQQTGSAV